MPGQAGENDAVRVSPTDQRGRPISPPVLSAAKELSRRAIRHAERLRIDPAVAANLLEEAAATVSRALKDVNECPVRDLESYLFRAFLRRLNRAKKRQSLLAEAIELEAFLSRLSSDPRRALEMKILIDELLMQCNPVSRDMLCRRLADCSWRDVGQAYGISAHAAESKFSQALQRVRKKLGLK
jgi:DNA-directed RNA polymerase specialized sigma24 family protein